jgi:hypothetical protein
VLGSVNASIIAVVVAAVAAAAATVPFLAVFHYVACTH